METRIAVREIEAGGRRIAVDLRLPEQVGADEWRCVYSFTEGDRVTHHAVHGLDAMQALQVAFAAMRAHLDTMGGPVTWAGGSVESGFPRVIPAHLGEAFASKLEHVIDQAVGRETERLSSSSR